MTDDPILRHLETMRDKAAESLAAIDADIADYKDAATATPALIRLRDVIKIWRCTYEAGLRRCQRGKMAVKNDKGEWLVPRSLVFQWF